MSDRAPLRLAALGPGAPREFTLDRDRLTVGAAPGNDLLIEVTTVSRRHATLERRAGAWCVVDHNSTNGTFVNGVRISGEAPIKPGDELCFGTARYSLIRPPPRPRRRRVTYAAIIALVFAGGFAIAEYLINWDRLEGARWAGAPASPPAAAPAARSPIPVASPAPSTLARAMPSVPAPIASVVPEATPAPAAAEADPPWLAAVNRYRTQSGLAPVANDATTSRGDQNHARYLVENFKDSISRGISTGAAMHREDPANRWYTPAGQAAANASDVAEWPGPAPPPSPLWALDGWMSGPFHRVSILNPRLRSASLGSWCEGAVCVVALNVVAGAAVTAIGTAMPNPVRFPAPDSTLTMNSSEGEWPDPLSACPGYAAPSGLPITLQVALFRAVKLDSFSLALDGAALSPIEACGIDASSYVSPDPEAQRRARGTLSAYGTVIVVPRQPLAAGRYTVAITADGQSYSWSFTIAPAAD
ncbi:MAG: FHA domain-containing protein [Candidatus Binataceae bacterium]|nr:FHA domain-containing protein [Candidatus Binataceae bacterium]